jgi:hypothetical protein
MNNIVVFAVTYLLLPISRVHVLIVTKRNLWSTNVCTRDRREGVTVNVRDEGEVKVGAM